MKNEKLKKLEIELHDLEHWLNLGLVPKKDLEKHHAEIEVLQQKIADEHKRLQAVKENGDAEDYVTPKKGPAPRQIYQEPHTLPGVENDSSSMTDAGLDLETESYETEPTNSGTEAGEEKTVVEEEEDDPFSDKNRWRRGMLGDPDSDQW